MFKKMNILEKITEQCHQSAKLYQIDPHTSSGQNHIISLTTINLHLNLPLRREKCNLRTSI